MTLKTQTLSSLKQVRSFLAGAATVPFTTPTHQDLPVVLASGYLTDQLREQALAVGIRQVLHKPASVDDLLVTIKSLLGNAPMR